MDRTMRDLEAVVSSQKEQLSRYEKRLKDVITAYKGLLKEKEALETSFAAISTNSLNDTNVKVQSEGAVSYPVHTTDASANEKTQLQTQIITLMNSLATLSAEKSRMEASFQADKKQLRSQILTKDKAIDDLQLHIKEVESRAKSEIDEVKAKWIVERQEREQETNNQMLMIRELQKLYADERHLKENIEMQLNNFKTQFASDEAENLRLKELQAQLKDARAQLKQIKQAGSKELSSGDELEGNATILKQVQREMQQLKEQHAVAIKNEQKRVHFAEERSKKLASLHEERVANLEARLAELSTTVGTYDRLRQLDQKNIHELKQKLQDIDGRQSSTSVETIESPLSNNSKKISVASTDITSIVDEISRLKKLLITENARSTHPIDVQKVLSVGADHDACREELCRLQQQFENAKSESLQMQEKLQVQRTHIYTLQKKVEVLNYNIDEQELELKQRNERQHQAVMDERAKWKEALLEMENECRSKIYEMEQQLQKQRQRSLQLLDEKEQEIKTLQTSFEVFHTAASAMPAARAVLSSTSTDATAYAASSDGESVDGGQKTVSVKSKKLSVGENCHMLHYANEIARKDIEISSLRKTKYAAETALRKAIHEKVTVQQELGEKIDELEEQVDRLERCKTREGANLEYLKNVIISFIVTKELDGKQHMLNAISAVLQLTPSEIQTINAAFSKK